MLHPSYSDLIKVVNSEVEEGEAPVVNSRYSIVMATSKRARQLISGEEAYVPENGRKPLSVAVEELNASKIHILAEDEEPEEAAAAFAETEAEAGETEAPETSENADDPENGEAPAAEEETANTEEMTEEGGEEAAEESGETAEA